MRWGVAVLLLTALAGCKTCDLVEAELRYESRRARQLERCLCQKQAEVETLKQQLSSVEKSAAPGAGKETPETVYRRTAMSRVSLGMGTGGRDLDRDGENEAVQFTIVCHDYDGDAFKCPGKAELKLSSRGADGATAVVGEWTIEPDVLRQKWKSSVLGSGYQVIVPVEQVSDSKKWTMSVRFTTLDGREFQDERSVEMKVSPPMTVEIPKSGPPASKPPLPADRPSTPVLPPAKVPEPKMVPEPPKTPDKSTAAVDSPSWIDRGLVPTVGLTESAATDSSTKVRRVRFLRPQIGVE